MVHTYLVYPRPWTRLDEQLIGPPQAITTTNVCFTKRAIVVNVPEDPWESTFSFVSDIDNTGHQKKSERAEQGNNIEGGMRQSCIGEGACGACTRRLMIHKVELGTCRNDEVEVRTSIAMEPILAL